LEGCRGDGEDERQWTTEELVEQWSLDPGDEQLFQEKRRRLGC
jgi:hypothetical protein